MQTHIPGTVLATRVGPFTHFGIASDRVISGEQTVLSCSLRRGAMVEERASEFSDGRQVEDRGYWGNLRPSEVVGRARSQIGRQWDALRFNCEHAVRISHGLPPASPQLAACAAIGVALVLVFVVSHGKSGA